MADIIDTLNIDKNTVDNNNSTETFKNIPNEGPVNLPDNEIQKQDNNIVDNNKITQYGPVNPGYVENDYDKFLRINKEQDIKNTGLKNMPTDKDYEDLYRTGALLNNHPETQTNYYDIFEPWDVNNKEYIDNFKKADRETRKLMNEAPNHIIANNIYNRRKITEEDMLRVNNDNFINQTANALYYGVASYDTLIPGFTIFKGGKLAYKTAKAGLTMSKLKGAGNLAFNISLATAYNEATFGATGLDTNLMNALVVNNGVGFTLDYTVKALAGRYGKRLSTELAKPRGKSTDISQPVADNGLIKNIDEEGIPYYTTPEDEGWVKTTDSKGKTTFTDPNYVNNIVDNGKTLEVKENGKVDVEVELSKKDIENMSKEDKQTTFEMLTEKQKNKVETFELSKSDKGVKPKVFKKDGKFNDDLSKTIYIAGSNGKQANKFNKILKKSFSIPKKEVKRIHEKIKQKIINGEEINIQDVAPDIHRLLNEEIKPTKIIEVEPEQIKDKIVLQDVGQGNTSFYDKLTKNNFIGRFTTSDASILFQSKNKKARQQTARITTDTVTQFDSLGNPLSLNKTAGNVIKDLEGIKDDLDFNLETNHVEYNANKNNKKLSYDDYTDLTLEQYKNISIQQEIDAYKYANIELEKIGKKLGDSEALTNKYLDEYYNNNKVDFTRFENKGLEEINKYSERMLKEYKEKNVKGFDKVNPNKVYIHRQWNLDAFKDMPKIDIIETLKKAIQAHPGNGYLNNIELEKLANKYFDNFYKKSRNRSTIADFFKSIEPNSNVGKEKTILVDDRLLGNLIKKDYGSVIESQYLQGRGKIAIKHAFGEEDASKVFEDFKAERDNPDTPEITDAEVEAFERLLLDTMGTLRRVDNPNSFSWRFTRSLTKINTLTMGGNFGLLQMAESSAILSWQSFDGLMKGSLGRSLKSTTKELVKKGSGQDDYTRLLRMSGMLGSNLAAHRSVSYVDDIGGTTGVKWYDNILNKAQDKYMTANLLKPVLHTTENAVGSNIIFNLSKDIYDVKTLSRLGLTKKAAKELRDDINNKFNLTNDENMDLDLSNLDKVNRDRLKQAIQNGMNELIVRTDGFHTPPVFKLANPILKLAFQFLPFVFTITQTLVKRGLREQQYRLAAYTLSSSLVILGSKYAIEQAEIASGLKKERDSKYDYFNDPDAMINGLKLALSYSAIMGPLSVADNLYAGLTQGTPLLNNYKSRKNIPELVFGPTASTLGKGQKIISDILKGEADSYTAHQAIKLMPFNNLFYLNGIIKAIEEEIK